MDHDDHDPEVRMVGLAASKKAAIEEAEKTLEEFKEMKPLDGKQRQAVKQLRRHRETLL